MHRSAQKPESALVAFAETDHLELIFETFDYSRKYLNLKHNPLVSFVVGWDEKEHITLQYEGCAREAPPERIKEYQSILLSKKTPCTAEFLLHPRAKLFLVSPRWIGFSDYTQRPSEILEMNF